MRIFAIIVASLLGALALFIIIFAGIGMMLSDSYHVSRSIDIKAPPTVIHEYVGNLDKWGQWEPFRKQDPSMRVTVGQATGVGAHQTWMGSDDNGRLVFTQSNPATGISYDFFMDNDAMRSSAQITYTTEGSGVTQVAWTTQGNVDIPVLGGYFAMLIDGFLGPIFENGLQNLKQVVEAAPAPEAPAPTPEPAPAS